MIHLPAPRPEQKIPLELVVEVEHQNPELLLGQRIPLGKILLRHQTPAADWRLEWLHYEVSCLQQAAQYDM